MPAKVKPTVQEIIQLPTTLVELTAEAARITDMVMRAGGELTPELESLLDVTVQALMAKVDGYVFIEEQLDAQAVLWKRRAQACAAVQKRFEAAYERLHDRIKYVMIENDKKELPGNLYCYKLANRPPKLVIEDERKLPPELKVVVQTTAPDKDRIKTMLADGFHVVGCRLEPVYALSTRENAEND